MAAGRGRRRRPGAFRRALLAGGVGVACLAAGSSARADPVDLDVRVLGRFDGSGERFGDLLFRGGLVVRAAGVDGLSALAVAGEGRLVALGDRGAVLSAAPVFLGGRLSGLADARLRRRLGPDGRPVAGKAAADAEGMVLLPPAPGAERGTWLVAVESGRKLLAYADGDDGPAGAPLFVRTPPRFAHLVRRGGLEALAVAPAASPVAGHLFVFQETVLDGERDIRGWRGEPVAPGDRDAGKAPAFGFRPIHVVARDGYAVTGAAFLPGGDLLLLERRWRGGLDIAMRIRRIGRDDVARDRLDGPVVLEADAGAEIDNMEGIAVAAGPDGGVRVLVVSDDNANFLQRTLLLAFRLDTPVPRPRPAAAGDPGQPRAPAGDGARRASSAR